MKKLFAAAVAATFLAGAANAAVITINSVSGTWGSIVGGTNLSGVGTSVLGWGTGGTSSYTFTPDATPFVVAASPFQIGTFTHANQPIGSGTSITGATLSYGVLGDVDGQAFSLTGTAAFLHAETPNACAPLPVCANDIVTLLGTTSIGDMLTLPNGDTIALELTGFSGGVNFSSPEGGNNSAPLFGQFVITPVPVPASLPLLLAGFGGLALLKRRKKA